MKYISLVLTFFHFDDLGLEFARRKSFSIRSVIAEMEAMSFWDSVAEVVAIGKVMSVSMEISRR